MGRRTATGIGMGGALCLACCASWLTTFFRARTRATARPGWSPQVTTSSSRIRSTLSTSMASGFTGMLGSANAAARPEATKAP